MNIRKNIVLKSKSSKSYGNKKEIIMRFSKNNYNFYNIIL